MSQDQPLNPNDLWRPHQPPAPNKPLTFAKVKQIFADMDEGDRQERERMHREYQTRLWVRGHLARFGMPATYPRPSV